MVNKKRENKSLTEEDLHEFWKPFEQLSKREFLIGRVWIEDCLTLYPFIILHSNNGRIYMHVFLHLWLEDIYSVKLSTYIFNNNIIIIIIKSRKSVQKVRIFWPSWHFSENSVRNSVQFWRNCVHLTEKWTNCKYNY